MKIFSILSGLFLILPTIYGRSNKEKLRNDLNRACDLTLYGEEVGELEYAQAIIAVGLDVFAGFGGSASLSVAKSILKDQVEAFGWEAVQKVIFDGDVLEATVDGRIGDIRGGVLTYDHEGWTCNCCFWICGGFPCSGCSCSKCGETTWPSPNTHQPYLCFTADERGASGGNPFNDPAPQSLAFFHQGCDSPGKSRTPDCVSAMHQHCLRLGYGVGFSVEVGTTSIGVVCTQPEWYGDVEVSTLRDLHSGCELTRSQTADCVAAIHRYCTDEQGANVGISQEVGIGVFGVACFSGTVHHMKLADLQTFHDDCNTLSRSQSDFCVAAISRACKERGFGAGVSQEVGSDEFAVACFNVEDERSVRIR
ncbi:unnamed protein product [Chrysoparadoxa australica]